MEAHRSLSLLSLLTLLLIGSTGSAQNIGINEDGSTPDPSAILDIRAVDKGLLIPRLSDSQMQSIAAPSDGLLIYNSDQGSFYFYENNTWVQLLDSVRGDGHWNRNGSTLHTSEAVALGRSEADPAVGLHMDESESFLIGDSTSGEGFKMIYYADKGAFRAGYLSNSFGGYDFDRFWDYDSCGYYSFAAGRNALAKGFESFAFGNYGHARGTGSVAFFGTASGNNSISFSGNSKGPRSFSFRGVTEEEGGIAMYGYTGGRYGVAIGGGSTGLGASSSREDYAVAIGWNADARGQASVALGPSDAYGYNSFSTGWVTEARGNYSSTFGYRTISYPAYSMAIGRYNLVQGDSANYVSTDPAFMIGDGTSTSNRSNSFCVLKNGSTSMGLDNPNARLHVSSTGTSGQPTIVGILESNASNRPLLLFSENSNSTSLNDGMSIEYNGSATGIDNKLVMNGIGGTPFLEVRNDGIVSILDGELRIANPGGNVNIRMEDSSGNADRVVTRNPDNHVFIGDIDNNGGDCYVRAAGSNRMVIQGGGNVGIGTTNPTARLTVVGTANKTGGGSWSVYSDRRLKTDVRDYADGLTSVLKVRPVRYRYNEKSGADTQTEYVGVIAQELKEVAPYMVSEVSMNEGEYLQVDNSAMTYMLINAIKEQQELIDTLSKRIDQLESREGETREGYITSSASDRP